MRFARPPGPATVMLGAALCLVSVPAPAQDAGAEANAVLDRHLRAFATHDIEALMKDYSENAVFVTPSGVLEGKPAIRALFEALVHEFEAPGARLTLERRLAQGPLAYTLWSAETPEHSYEFATDTLYVEDGLIRYQTFAADVRGKE